ncbi:MAG: RodZ domain-containing protein [Dongiaceae bacterium]
MTTGQRVGTTETGREEMQPGAVGRLLRETRESYQQDIAAVSQQLRIRGVYLRAIEDGNYQALPGSTYAVGFVRSYSEYLGLDPLELVRRFRDEAALVNRRTQLVFPVPTAEAKVPSGAVLLIGLVVALLAYGGWFYLSDRDRDLVDMIPAVPESLQEMANATIGTDDESESEISASSATAAEAPAQPAEPAVAETATILGETPVVAAEASDTGSAATAPAATATATSDPALDGAAIDPASGQTAASVNQSTTATAAETLTAGATQTETVDPAAEAAASDATSTDSDVDEAATADAASVEEAPLTPLAPAGAGTDSADGDAATTAAGTTQVASIPEAPRVPETVRDGVGYGVAFAGSRVVIVARMESWVEVQNAEGEAIWARVLRSGDRYLVPDQPGLTMTVGNAGGIDVFVDGDKAPSLGTVGVGRRGVMLDPERLASGTALP